MGIQEDSEKVAVEELPVSPLVLAARVSLSSEPQSPDFAPVIFELFEGSSPHCMGCHGPLPVFRARLIGFNARLVTFHAPFRGFNACVISRAHPMVVRIAGITGVAEIAQISGAVLYHAGDWP